LKQSGDQAFPRCERMPGFVHAYAGMTLHHGSIAGLGTNNIDRVRMPVVDLNQTRER
jgi:hypothetical protein